jgi:ATP-dependent DNA helicase RecG
VEFKYEDFYTVIFRLKELENSLRTRSERVNDGCQEKEGRLVEKLGENERKVLTLISQNRKASITYIAVQTELSSTGIEKIITRLKGKKVLKRVGPAKGGHWEIVE